MCPHFQMHPSGVPVPHWEGTSKRTVSLGRSKQKPGIFSARTVVLRVTKREGVIVSSAKRVVNQLVLFHEELFITGSGSMSSQVDEPRKVEVSVQFTEKQKGSSL